MVRRRRYRAALRDRWPKCATICIVLLCVASCRSGNTDKADDTSSEARDVLSKTLAAYRDEKAYSDRGALYLSEAREDAANVERPPLPFSLVLRRPNQIQFVIDLPIDDDAAIVGQSVVVSDGERMRVRTEAQQEVLEISSPDSLGLKELQKGIDDSIVGRAKLPTPRLQMLLGTAEVDEIFPGLEQAKLLENDSIGESECLRVALPNAFGDRIYWIDVESHLLRRVEFPPEEAKKAFAWHPQLNIAAARLEFEDAKFEADDDIERYRMNVSDDALLVREWLPPPPAPLGQLLGETVADFHFTDLEGHETTAKSLSDKIVVLDFWATWCKPCLASMPKLNRLVKKYEDNPKVQFMAVNTEEPSVSNEAIRDVFKNNHIELSSFRDLASFHRLTFGVDSLPTTVILDGAGKIQMIETAASDEAIEKTIEALLTGKDVAAERKREYREAIAEREKFLTKVLVGGPAGAASTKIAAKSQPSKLKLTKLWSSEELIQPGYIIVAESTGNSPRVYVHDGWNSVVELGLDGKAVETHDLALPEDAPVSISRTVVDKSGNRHFVAFATRQKQVHVFDNLWKLRFSYPDTDVSHPGIANVLLADLDGDDAPEINISFWGVAGVQSLSLEGKRLWPQKLIKSLEDIRGLAATSADEKGQRRLIAAHYDPALATIEYGGERGRDIVVASQVLFDVVSAEFDGSQKYCVLSSGAQGQIAALGIDERGEILWTRELPGVPELLVQHVTTGMLPTSATAKARHWVLLAPDNSLQFVNAEGKILDQFNYGSQLRAVAIVEQDGKSILLASTPENVDAWEISFSEGMEKE